MIFMILYPTETLYALGVDVCDDEALKGLYDLKGRSEQKAMSVLVRSITDIESFAILPTIGREIANSFLPGPLTLVLSVRSEFMLGYCMRSCATLGFRVSSDPIAQTVIHEHMALYGTPLTCTSANKSGEVCLSTTKEIREQIGDTAMKNVQIIDDGPRMGMPSTIVLVTGEKVKIVREGSIPRAALSPWL